jgi:hypothetical protein
MTIDAATLALDHTTHVAPTGGSALAISRNTSPKTNAVIASQDAETDFLTRTSVEFSFKSPIELLTAPGGYTQAREVVLVKSPMTLANGNRTVNTLSITCSRDPEMTTGDFKSLRLIAVQLLGSVEYDLFWAAHNLS